jgi:hypothetical protein
MNTTRREPKDRVYVLRLEGKPDAAGAHVRTLKLLLKHLWRVHGLRCIEAREGSGEKERSP